MSLNIYVSTPLDYKLLEGREDVLFISVYSELIVYI